MEKNNFGRIIIVEIQPKDNPNKKMEISNVPIKINIEKQLATEPNFAEVDIYNITQAKREALNYKFDFYRVNFGSFVTIYTARNKDEKPKQLFSGSIVKCDSSQQGTEIVTKIKLRNIIFEHLGKSINPKRKIKTKTGKIIYANKTYPAGTSKADVILDLLKHNNLSVHAEHIKLIKQLVTSRYKTSYTPTGTIENFINKININILSNISLYSDDAGTTFLPTGKPLKIPVKTYSKTSFPTLIGSPTLSERGIDFEITLEPSLRINAPVKINSIATMKNKYNNIFVVKKINHIASNFVDNDFKTVVETVYSTEDQTNTSNNFAIV